MKRYFKLMLVSIFSLAAVACTPDSHELGQVDITAEQLINGVAFSVEQDSADPNTIYLKNLLPQYTPLWEHPQGRSQANEITLKIPFKGTYTVKFGVMTRGGYVYGEPYSFELTTDNLAYVDDPLWNILSGGPGNEKSWVLDINADGVCKYFVGPLYFYGTDDTYDVVTNGNAAVDYNGDGTIDSWSWAADWAGNGSWLFSSTGAMDYGTMTFDLKDGAHVKVENLASGETFNGSYMLNIESYTLTLTDAELLHDPGRDAIVTKWGDCRVLSLTEEAMQLGVIRDNDPNEGPCLLVYNFISKEYSDNWTPSTTEPEGPTEPVLPDGWEQTVGTISQTSIKWTLDTNLPLEWFSPAGAALNGWTSGAEYPDWLGVLDASIYEGFSLTMDSADKSYTAVGVDGVEIAGSYSLDEKGIYTFDNGLPSFALVGWASFAADADNQLRILAINTNKAGIVTDMWVGAKALNEDGTIKEYMGYHLVANVGAGGGAIEPEPEGYATSIYFTNTGWWPSGNGESINVTGDGAYTCSFSAGGTATNDVMVFCVDMVGLKADYPLASAKVTEIRADGVALDFDPAKIAYGDLEGNGNLRIEIANTWGSTAGNYAIAESTSFSDTIEVDFEVQFEGKYKAQIMVTNDGWWPGYSGVDEGSISGPGIYKMAFDLSDNGAITAPMVFCLDVLAYENATTAVAGVRSMKAFYEDGSEAELSVKAENLSYGDLEQKGNLRWEFFNIYGSTGNGVTSAPYDYSKAVIDGAEFAAGVVGLEMVVTVE